MSAPALRLVCALAPFAFLFPVALQGQGDDSTTRGYAPTGPSGGPAAPARPGREGGATT